MSQGEQKDSITDLRKWNLIAGGIDPKNDVIPASLGYGLENALEFAMTEIGRLEARIKGLEDENNTLRSEESRLLNTNGEMERRIQRLEKAGEDLAVCGYFMGFCDELKAWRKALKDSR
jgi:FtsZ-binding cell division protein ZapB